MHYISLDTNTWIYLANGTEPVRLLYFIKEQILKGNIILLLPELVKTEWDNNKERKVMQGSLNYFKNIFEEFDKILRLLGDNEKSDVLNFLLVIKDDSADLRRAIEKFKQKKESLKNVVTKNIELIDDIFQNHSKIIKIRSEDYMKAGQYALEKKAPFKAKNSFADALILFSLLNYVEVNSIENSMFISYNTNDFCEKKTDGTISLHSDLIHDFEVAKCRYFRIVGEAINTIKEIITKEELELIEYLQNEYEPEYCNICSEMHGKLSTISFHKHDLKDERTLTKNDDLQLKINFGDEEENIIKNLIKTNHTTIDVGSCDWCNTEHFICINCNTVNSVWDEEYGEKKECKGCGLNYLIEDYDYWDETKPCYIIAETKLICEKCGEEFEEENMSENLCLNCEEKYFYGDT